MALSEIERPKPTLYLSGEDIPYDSEDIRTGDTGTITLNFIVTRDSLTPETGEKECTLQVSVVSLDKKKRSLEESADMAENMPIVKTHISPAP